MRKKQKAVAGSLVTYMYLQTQRIFLSPSLYKGIPALPRQAIFPFTNLPAARCYDGYLQATTRRRRSCGHAFPLLPDPLFRLPTVARASTRVPPSSKPTIMKMTPYPSRYLWSGSSPSRSCFNLLQTIAAECAIYAIYKQTTSLRF